jgi:uracil-DNA glycosylase
MSESSTSLEMVSDSWDPFFEKSDSLIKKLLESIEFNETTFPPKNQILRVLSMPVKDIKVVILGQDPYHGVGQANGLCFSVYDGIQHPPSLINIFKGIESKVLTVIFSPSIFTTLPL